MEDIREAVNLGKASRVVGAAMLARDTALCNFLTMNRVQVEYLLVDGHGDVLPVKPSDSNIKGSSNCFLFALNFL